MSLNHAFLSIQNSDVTFQMMIFTNDHGEQLLKSRSEA